MRRSDVKPNINETCCYRNNKNLDFLARAVKPAAKGSDIVDVDSEWPNNYQISAASVPHLENVYSNLRQKIGRKSGDDTNDLDTNSLIWEILMSATLDAAVHLGKDYLDNTPNGKAIDRRVTEVDHRSKRYQRVAQMLGTHTHGKGQLC